jgi:RNA polymerase sigma factor (sigma-70 family)
LGTLDDPDFESFVLAETPRLLRLARAVSRSHHDAWDLVQETLARVGLRWNAIRNRDDPFAYARRTLINLNLNRTRRLRREYLMASPPWPGRSGDDDVYVEWLEDAVARLSPKQRAAVSLAYVEDLPISDIAHILGCSQSTAKTHLYRARESLRAAAPSRHSPIAVADPAKD